MRSSSVILYTLSYNIVVQRSARSILVNGSWVAAIMLGEAPLSA